MGFVSSWLPLPLAHGVLGRLRKHGMAALYLEGLYRAIGRNQHFHPYDALEVHGAGEAGILRNHLGHNFADAFRRFLGRSRAGNEHQYWQKNK